MYKTYELKKNSSVTIIDATEDPKCKRYLYLCIFHTNKDSARNINYIPYRHRHDYLKFAVPKGFRKTVLLYKGDHVGSIEYAPAEVSGLPIIGKNIIVMNCIWVQRRAAGRGFGTLLVMRMMDNYEKADGFATLACENYHRVYLKKDDMERLGFKSVNSIKVKHKGMRSKKYFKIHLMWKPVSGSAKPPTWNEQKLLQGLFFCEHHPLFHGRHGCEKMKAIFEKEPH